MASVEDLAARDSAAHKAAHSRLAAHVIRSEEQQNKILEQVISQVILDKLVPPKSLLFRAPDASRIIVVLRAGVVRSSTDPIYNIHNHALGQLADVAGLPRIYQTRLRDSGELWKQELLSYNLETLFHETQFVDKKKRPKRFLLRVVGDQVRGFLSQTFNRKLTTAPLLRSFIESCRELEAGPVETTSTDVRIRVKYMLPYIFEPVDGEFVAFGATFSNSDFGAGRLSVSGTIMRMGTETMAVLSDKYSRTHLGSVIQDSDLEMSEETAGKELDTVKSAIRDKVIQSMGTEAIERGIRAIQDAHELVIPWYKVANLLGEVMTKSELDLMTAVHDTGIVTDLPEVQTAAPTAWWLANAVGKIAQGEVDLDRKAQLQELAGKLITG